MKKLLGVILVLIVIISGCNTVDEFVYWTETESTQIQRLDDANINYDIRDREIWVKEKDMAKAVTCCF